MSVGGLILLGTFGFLLLPFILHYLDKWSCRHSWQWLTHIVSKLHDAVRFDSFSTFFILVGLSWLGLIIWIATIQMIALDLDVNIPWLLLGIIVVLVELVRLVPVTIQGIGVREGAYAYLFTLFDKSAETGFILATISYLALSVSLILSGCIGWFLLYYSHSQSERDKDMKKQSGKSMQKSSPGIN